MQNTWIISVKAKHFASINKHHMVTQPCQRQTMHWKQDVIFYLGNLRFLINSTSWSYEVELKNIWYVVATPSAHVSWNLCSELKLWTSLKVWILIPQFIYCSRYIMTWHVFVKNWTNATWDTNIQRWKKHDKAHNTKNKAENEK